MDIVGLDTQKISFKKKTQKTSPFLFVCFFLSFCLTPFEHEMETSNRANTQKKEEEDERDVLSCNNHTNTINAKVNNRKQHWVHMLLSNQPKEKNIDKRKKPFTQFEKDINV